MSTRYTKFAYSGLISSITVIRQAFYHINAVLRMYSRSNVVFDTSSVAVTISHQPLHPIKPGTHRCSVYLPPEHTRHNRGVCNHSLVARSRNVLHSQARVMHKVHVFRKFSFISTIPLLRVQLIPNFNQTKVKSLKIRQIRYSTTN